MFVRSRPVANARPLRRFFAGCACALAVAIVVSCGHLAFAQQTFNQNDVESYINAHAAGPLPNMQSLINDLATLSQTDYRSTIDSLTPQINATIAQLQVQSNGLFYMMLRRLAGVSFGLEVLIDGQDGSPGESYASENFAAQEVTILPVSRQTGDPSSLFQKASTRPPPRIPWGGWSTGYGMGGFAQGNHGAAGGIFGTGGTVACAERFLDEHTAMGFYGAYANMSVRTVDDIDQGASFDEGMFGSYFIHHSEHSYLLTAGTMGFAGFRELRRVDTSPFRLTAKGNYNGWNPSAYIERGVHIPIGQTIITPFGALQYIYVRQNPFVETGAGALNLAVAGTDTPAFRSILASRITRVCYLKNGWFVAPEVRAGWVHEFLNPVTTVNSTFAPIGGPTFPTRGLNLGRDSMITGGGMQLWLTHRLSLYAQYDLNFNTYQAWHAGSGGFQFGW